ncbi:MAG: hypothetical protein LQ342_003309 [Letrouitia transgressa]|nr:MAG: hypothetical protein LQ342_003309 [Letrouitia transgressa]
MNKAITLSRDFYNSGQRVIGADTSSFASGRVSNSVRKFYKLPVTTTSSGPSDYVFALLQIITRERVDLWVSCSGVSDEVIDGRARDVILRQTQCRCVQFSASLTEELHEKDKFVSLCQRLGLGDAVPETHAVDSRDSVHRLLQASPYHSTSQAPAQQLSLFQKLQQKQRNHQQTRQFILKSIGVNDATRSDMTLLPRRTPSLTYDHVAALRISKNQPYILQQYIPGKEFCTHSLIVHGQVKAFVCCPSTDLLMHYTALPSDDPVAVATLNFTRDFAGRLQEELETDDEDGNKENKELTGHLSFDFLVSTSQSPNGAAVTWDIKCIECNPRPHTAVALFSGRQRPLAEAYLSALDTNSTRNGKGGMMLNGHAFPPSAEEETSFTQKEEEDGDMEDTPAIKPQPHTPSVYWTSHDFVTLGILPLFHLFLSPTRQSLTAYRSSLFMLINHLLFWQDGLFSLSDPLPWWWSAHVFWPTKFGLCIKQLVQSRLNGNSTEGMWNRLNVSTGKMFGC